MRGDLAFDFVVGEFLLFLEGVGEDAELKLGRGYLFGFLAEGFDDGVELGAEGLEGLEVEGCLVELVGERGEGHGSEGSIIDYGWDGVEVGQ